MLINEAPIEERDALSPIWLRFFASVGKSLQGEWGSYTAPLESTTDGTQTVKIRNKGATAQIQIKIEGITSTGVLTLPYSVEETILNVWEEAMRDACGLSRSESKVAANAVFKALDQREVGIEQKEVMDSITNLTNILKS